MASSLYPETMNKEDNQQENRQTEVRNVTRLRFEPSAASEEAREGGRSTNSML